MPNGNRVHSSAIASAETWLNAVALGACWVAALFFLAHGWSDVAAARLPPGGPREVLAALWGTPPTDVARWAWTLARGVAELGVSGVLAFSAAEGSWWIARRLGRA